MNLVLQIKSVWRIIARNKMRSFLTMLGIIIGVTAVIVVMSVGAGAQSLILNEIKSLGSNLVVITPGKSDEKGPPVSAFGVTITSLKNDDIEAIMKDNSHILFGSGFVNGSETVNWGDQKIDTTFTGASSQLLDLQNLKLASGRFFTEEEDKGAVKVAIIGAQVAKDLFGDQNPLGLDIKIKKTTFNIIGVLENKGSSGLSNQDNQIYVPLNTAQKLLLGINYVKAARFNIDNADNVNDAMERVRYILRDRHDIDKPEDDDFTVQSMAQGLEAITKITDAIRLFLAAVAAIALVVGGIGIMNIMLAAVQERTREIGLRKAVGAKNKNIIEQFLIESVMITVIGGIAGIMFGILLSFITAKVVQSLGYNWDFIITFSSILIGVAVSVGVGLLFGISPAKKAARLNPIEALRYE